MMSEQTPDFASPAITRIAYSSLQQFLDISPDALIVTNQVGKIVLANEQAEHLFGYAGAELPGQQLELLLPMRFRPSHGIYREAYFATPLTRPMGAGLPLFGLHKTGKEFPVDISLKPLLLDDLPHTISAIRDVTRQKELYERQVDRIKSEIISRISHQLRTPLTSVKGFVDILLEDQEESALQGEQREFLQIVQDETMSIIALINDMFDISQKTMPCLTETEPLQTDQEMSHSAARRRRRHVLRPYSAT